MGLGRQSRSPLSSLNSPRRVEDAIRHSIPLGTAASEVSQIARQIGLECSAVEDGRMTCSAPAESGLPFVRAKWLAMLSFENDLLTSVAVKKGFIGP
jgi:hypothetical protein